MRKRTADPDRAPRLVHSLLRKAQILGMTEEALCRELGTTSYFLSRWKQGQRLAPDPRDPKWKPFYTKAAGLLDQSLGQVVSQVLFFEPHEERELDQWLLESVERTRKYLSVLNLSKDAQEQLRLILLNLPGREAFLTVLTSTLKSYVTGPLRQKWAEQPLEAAKTLLEQRQIDQKNEAYFGYSRSGL